MKRITLRKEASEAGDILDWADVTQQVVRKPLDTQRGADIAEMRKGIRILDALEKSNGVLELEDSDWEHLKEKVNAMQWGMVDRRIVKYVDDVMGATEKETL